MKMLFSKITCRSKSVARDVICIKCVCGNSSCKNDGNIYSVDFYFSP